MSDDYGFGTIFKILAVAVPMAVLGVWKLVEIILWVIQHITISW